MDHPVSWIDRLRIERVVWALDQRLYDLPRRSRIGHRRDVRANLLTASHDVGTRAALRQLGTSAQPASEYLSAEYGANARHSWIAASYVAAGGVLVFTWVLAAAILAFRHGIVAADPHATGTYRWAGIPYIQDHVTYTLTDGQGGDVGGAWTPLLYAIWIALTMAAGRLWRIPLGWWRRRRRTALATSTN